MPTYEYSCSRCGHGFEIRESMSDHKERTKCPECGRETLHQVYGLSTTIVYGGLNETVGQYAERNTRRISKDAIAEKEEKKIEEAEKRMGKKALQKKKGKRPWWRKTDKIDKSLTKLTPQQQKKYILTGEK